MNNIIIYTDQTDTSDMKPGVAYVGSLMKVGELPQVGAVVRAAGH